MKLIMHRNYFNYNQTTVFFYAKPFDYTCITPKNIGKPLVESIKYLKLNCLILINSLIGIQ